METNFIENSINILKNMNNGFFKVKYLKYEVIIKKVLYNNSLLGET